MRHLGILTLVACAACLEAQTPVDKAWTILSTAAQDKSSEKRGKAIRALGMISDNPRAQSTAESALKDANEEVRVAACEALGQMHAIGSASLLKAAIKDHEAAVVFAAADALFAIGDPAGYEVYYAVLTGERKSGDSLIESQMKMLKDPKALTQLGFDAGIGFVPFGGVALTVIKTVETDNVSPVRAGAAVKLIGDPDPKSVDALSDATKDKHWLVRAAVINALAKRHDSSVLPAITALLDDENDVVRFNAAAAVIHLTK